MRIVSGHQLVVDCLLFHLENPGEPELHEELQEQVPQVGGEEVGDVVNEPTGLRYTLWTT